MPFVKNPSDQSDRKILKCRFYNLFFNFWKEVDGKLTATVFIHLKRGHCFSFFFTALHFRNKKIKQRIRTPFTLSRHEYILLTGEAPH